MSLGKWGRNVGSERWSQGDREPKMPTNTEGRRVLDRLSPSEGPNHLGSSDLCLRALSQFTFDTCVSSEGGGVSNPGCVACQVSFHLEPCAVVKLDSWLCHGKCIRLSQQ